MRNLGNCGCSLIGRLLMFATRNAAAPAEPVQRLSVQRLSKAGSPPCAVMLTDSARSVA